PAGAGDGRGGGNGGDGRAGRQAGGAGRGEGPRSLGGGRVRAAGLSGGCRPGVPAWGPGAGRRPRPPWGPAVGPPAGPCAPGSAKVRDTEDFRPPTGVQRRDFRRLASCLGPSSGREAFGGSGTAAGIHAASETCRVPWKSEKSEVDRCSDRDKDIGDLAV